MYSLTTATRKVTALSKRLRCIQGGTSASKTISILLYLIAMAQSDTSPKITSIVSESFPHLKRGAIRDFLSIMMEHKYFQDERWNKTDYVYTFETGSRIEFFSVDQPGKVRGPRRDRLFINEANNVPLETFEQLEVRTKEFIFLDWNPSTEFWVYSEVIGKRTDVDHLTLTYLDNEALSKEIVDAIEQRKNNRGWWRVYGLGQLGEVEGRIYKGWQQLDAIPAEARLVRRWLDFGYANDPAAGGSIYKWNDAYVLDELVYSKGMLNNQLADVFKNEDEQCPIAADSAEPKSIDELKIYGLTVLPARKGKDSVNSGIQLVQQQKVFVTKRSTNIWREYNNYLWMADKDGKIINEPSPIWNHHMDGVRYGFETLLDSVPDHIHRQQERNMVRNAGRVVLNSAK